MSTYQSLIITPVKYENKYLNEYIEHYRNLGFTKMLIIDNNDSTGDYAEDIYDIIDANDNFIDVINKKDLYFNHNQLLKETYLNNYINYDFICFFDVDEFLELDEKYNNNINNYFDEDWCQTNECILINWDCFGFNNLTYYENKPLNERFTQRINDYYNNQTKIIVNCNNLKENIQGLEYTHKIKCDKICKGDGTIVRNINDILQFSNNITNIKLKHFIFKSIEEFLFKRCIKNNQDHLYSPNTHLVNLYCFNKELSNEQLDYIYNYINKFDDEFLFNEFKKLILDIYLDSNDIRKRYIENTYMIPLNLTY